MKNPFAKPADPYAVSQPASKKTMLLFGLGIAALLGLLAFVVFGTGGSGDGVNLRTALQRGGDALAAVEEYQDDLSLNDTKNTIALTRTLLSGDYRDLNDLYGQAYGAKSKLPNSPKLSKDDKSELDGFKAGNKIDSELIVYLRPKIEEAHAALKEARKDFDGARSLERIDNALKNLETVDNLLNQVNVISSAR